MTDQEREFCLRVLRAELIRNKGTVEDNILISRVGVELAASAYIGTPPHCRDLDEVHVWIWEAGDYDPEEYWAGEVDCGHIDRDSDEWVEQWVDIIVDYEDEYGIGETQNS